MKTRSLPLAAFALAMTLASPARAADPDPDPWLGKDKALHFGVSAGLAGAGYAMGAALFDARGHALASAGAATLAVGAGKELLDLAGYGDPSWRDFAADVAGTIVGLALAWGIDLAVRGVDDEHPLLRAPAPRAGAAAAQLVGSGLVVSF